MDCPRKLRPLTEYGEWACNPECDDPGPAERLLIDNRDRVEVLAEISDSEATRRKRGRVMLDRVCDDPKCPACLMLDVPRWIRARRALLAEYQRLVIGDAIAAVDTQLDELCVITVEQVRAMKGPPNGYPPQGWATFYREVMGALVAHPGVNPIAKSVIDAALS